MQKLFNAMSVASFTISVSIIAGSALLYTRIPSITQHYMGELTKMVTDMVPGQIDDVMPELPSVTGPALPF